MSVPRSRSGEEGRRASVASTELIRPLPERPGGRATFEPGDLVAGRYRILRFLARGGLGEVYEAESVELGERQALKVLRADRARDDAVVERFKREIQLARRVTHPNVCRIFDAGIHEPGGKGEALYLTMELLVGQTLHERIEQRGRLPLEEAEPIVRQLAAALEAAHRVGVIHRDFKSSNVILVPGDELEPLIDGTVALERAVVTDFGLARAAQPDVDDFRTRTGSLVGTPGFMAPEQVAGTDVTAASDLYALGVVLFHMVTGQLPFVGDTPLETALMRLHKAAPSPRERVPELPESWEEAILACLAREPGMRPPGPAALVARLTRPAGESTSTGRHKRGLPPIFAVGLAAVAAGSLLFAVLRKPAPAPVLEAPRAPSVVQLTTDPGLEVDPSFSPDGQSIVFSAESGGDFELRVVQLAAGGNQEVLTADAGRNVQPAWSPDGGRVAFFSQRRGGIWTVPATGGAATRLTSFGSRPSWSPEGRRLAFQEDSRFDLGARSAPALPPSTIYLIETAGGPPRQLTVAGEPRGGHGEPSWSPDGRRVVFSTNDRRSSEIWSIDALGGTPEPLVRGWQLAGQPLISRDGSTLYFSGIPPDARESVPPGLWRLALDPESGRPIGEAGPVTSLGSSTIRQFALSPDGKELIYGSLQTQSNLWTVPAEGGESRPLTTGNGRNNRAAWSPDGRWLAFDRWQIGRNLDVWLLDVAKGELRQLTVDAARDSQPSWYPDGRRVAFASDRTGSPNVFVADVADLTTSPLVDLGPDADWIRLSPDGGRLAFNSLRGGATINLWLHDLATGKAAQLTHDPEMVGFGAWSPDGRHLAAEAQRGEDSQVAVVDATTGQVELLTSDRGRSWPYSWSPDGQRVAFAGLRGEVWNVYTVSLGGEERRVTAYDGLGAYVRYPAWSPDGRTLVYELATSTGDLWLVEGLDRLR